MIPAWKETHRRQHPVAEVITGSVLSVPSAFIAWRVVEGGTTAVWLLPIAVLYYGILRWALNRTVLEVDGSGLAVRQGPLPGLPSGNFQVARSDAKRLLFRKVKLEQRTHYYPVVEDGGGRWHHLLGPYTNAKEPRQVIEAVARTWEWPDPVAEVEDLPPRGESPGCFGCVWMAGIVLVLMILAVVAQNTDIGFLRKR